jgi:hypothetical protein
MWRHNFKEHHDDSRPEKCVGLDFLGVQVTFNTNNRLMIGEYISPVSGEDDIDSHFFSH